MLCGQLCAALCAAMCAGALVGTSHRLQTHPVFGGLRFEEPERMLQDLCRLLGERSLQSLLATMLIWAKRACEEEQRQGQQHR